jgi:hypothetical protein
MQPHPLAADRRRGHAEVDLQLFARWCFKPQAGARLGLQRPAQRGRCALHRPQRYLDPMLTQQVLAHHVAIAPVLPEALPQPVLKPAETPTTTRRANRRPATRRQIALHRVPAAPQFLGDPPRPPAQLVQSHHRRHLVRRQHLLPPRIQPPGRASPQRQFHSSSFRRGQFLMSSGGQFFMSPDTLHQGCRETMWPSIQRANILQAIMRPSWPIVPLKCPLPHSPRGVSASRLVCCPGENNVPRQAARPWLRRQRPRRGTIS